MEVDKERIQQYAITSLKIVQAVVNSAATVFPCLSLASSFIGVLINIGDNNDDSIEELRKEFQKIDNGFDELTKEINEVINNIKLETMQTQFAPLEKNLERQHKEYMKVINAPPEEMSHRFDKFEKVYQETERDGNLWTLYESMIGVSSMSTDPILKVFKEGLDNKRDAMTKVCDHLVYLLSIGCITMLANAMRCGGNMEALEQEWEEKMKRVFEEIEKTLKDCQ
ncbi:protein rapunzel [Oryzias melastigma]|uniref:protein rapunzel n=1 Tax=Oryzias melastigma TaxID=30732 RepID=UPI000CF7BE42|nr:protein rapunzel [Oryzias melastigma]